MDIETESVASTSQTLHPWASESDSVTDQLYQNATYTNNPRSVLVGSLASVFWRWPETPSWLYPSQTTLVDAVIKRASDFGAHSMLITILSNAAGSIQSWMEDVKACNTSAQAIDLGLISTPSYYLPSTIRRDSKGTISFLHATRSLLLMDIIFWYLDSTPASSHILPQHPIYNNPFVDDGVMDSMKSTAFICSRLSNWEDNIVQSKDLEIQNNSPGFESMSTMGIDQGLVHIIENASKSASWGKVVRNIAAAALGIRLIIAPVRLFPHSLYATNVFITGSKH
jgi:hypothetical protein